MKRIALVYLGLIMVGGCDGATLRHRDRHITTSRGRSEQAAWKKDDPWYAPPPKSLWEKDKWTLISQDMVAEVRPCMVHEAICRLDKRELIRLTTERASEFANASRPEDMRIPFLVRAVRLDNETGTFSAYLLDGKLLICHDSLGRGPQRMIKAPLIVWLRAEPKRVFHRLFVSRVSVSEHSV